jgi:hypothetical protein
MEDNILETQISSDFFDKHKFQKQLDIIKHASEIAQAKIDYASAHDDTVIRAIEVVEIFLRKKHRLCYGGQAINAHLPAKYKFYDPEFSVPDYDIMTPSQDADILTLTRDLKKAGFTEISVREGMHEGTIKVYVDYVPVADMTVIDPKLYRILSKREYKIDGISYLDANTLRMLMYLELSRPRGEVGRWAKVFERLSLFNEFVPVKYCKISRDLFKGGLSKEQTQYTIDFIINNKRIFAGADLLDYYDYALKYKEQKNNWLLTSKKPIIFFSNETDLDAKNIREEFNFLNSQSKNAVKTPVTIKKYSSRGVDLIPSMSVLTQGNKCLVFIIDQSACHSYFNIPIDDGKIMRIASMDTLITLYFGLGLFDSRFYDMGSMECLANHLVKISIKAREQPETFAFPFISIKCSGHQTSLPSLIREKVKRITQKKQNIKRLENKPQTRFNKKRQTVKMTNRLFL